MTNPTTVFVTGATGFIGTKLVNELVRQGHTVNALTRATSNKEGLNHEKIKLVQGNMLDKNSLERGMQGCAQVYHLAAYAKNWAQDPYAFYEHNVEGMRNVFEAAKTVGIQRIVFTSTVVTFGPTRFGEVGNEDMPRITKHFYTEYEESKTAAEQEAIASASNGLPVVIVNPTRVYGPGKLTEGNSVSLMIDMYDRGKVPVLLNGGINVGNYVFVDDLVQGHILAMEKGRIGERYILGGENISLKGLFKMVDEVSQRKHFQVSLPPGIAKLYSYEELYKAKLLGMYPQITPGWVETFLQDWAYSCSKAERELGYRITPLREGIRKTYEWLIQQRKNSR